MVETAGAGSAGQWWEREDLGYRGGQLHFGGEALAAVAGRIGTPAFAYSPSRVRANLERLRGALDAAGVPHEVFYAIKANRYPPLLAALRSWRRCGIDACSPAELELALASGFAEHEISYTGTSVSNADLEVIRRYPRVHVNCDSLSTIRRLGERSPGREIGIRVNPQVGAGFNAALEYAGVKPTKFGVYADRFEEALALAAHYRLRIVQLHFHFGSGYLTPQLPRLAEALARTDGFLDRCPAIETLNIGGGMGVPLTAQNAPLDLAAWAAIIAAHVERRGLRIRIEPGDYLMKDAGALLAEVNTVEEKGGTLFVGVNAGFNLQNLAAFYRTPFVAAPLQWRADAPLRRLSIAGNINEAIDLLAEDIELPEPREGDLIALLNTGGYGAASGSNHCMRGKFAETLIG